MMLRSPAAIALIEAAAQRRAGAPVYLRCAFEVESGEDLVAHGAAAVAFACRVLGEPLDVCAIGVPPSATSREDAEPVEHLALTVRCRDGSVALLGIGRRPPGAPRAPPALLLLGDQGAVEPAPAPGGAGSLDPLVAAAAAGPSAEPAAVLSRYAAAIRRALASGRPEALDGE